MNYPEGATKQIRLRIAHKSRSYTLIGQLLYFYGRDGVLCHAVEKNVGPNLLQEFHEGFAGDSLRDKLRWKNVLRWDTIDRQCSRTL